MKTCKNCKEEIDGHHICLLPDCNNQDNGICKILGEECYEPSRECPDFQERE